MTRGWFGRVRLTPWERDTITSALVLWAAVREEPTMAHAIEAARGERMDILFNHELATLAAQIGKLP